MCRPVKKLNQGVQRNLGHQLQPRATHHPRARNWRWEGHKLNTLPRPKRGVYLWCWERAWSFLTKKATFSFSQGKSSVREAANSHAHIVLDTRLLGIITASLVPVPCSCQAHPCKMQSPDDGCDPARRPAGQDAASAPEPSPLPNPPDLPVPLRSLLKPRQRQYASHPEKCPLPPLPPPCSAPGCPPSGAARRGATPAVRSWARQGTGGRAHVPRCPRPTTHRGRRADRPHQPRGCPQHLAERRRAPGSLGRSAKTERAPRPRRTASSDATRADAAGAPPAHASAAAAARPRPGPRGPARRAEEGGSPAPAARAPAASPVPLAAGTAAPAPGERRGSQAPCSPGEGAGNQASASAPGSPPRGAAPGGGLCPPHLRCCPRAWGQGLAGWGEGLPAHGYTSHGHLGGILWSQAHAVPLALPRRGGRYSPLPLYSPRAEQSRYVQLCCPHHPACPRDIHVNFLWQSKGHIDYRH